MSAIIAIVGRPNVGKSMLFNRISNRRLALVGPRPGLTRDRQYHLAWSGERHFLVVDTGGVGEEAHDSQALSEQMREQTWNAAREADVLLWVLDGRTGLSAADEELAALFRRLDKPICLAVNKLEGLDAGVAMAEFYPLGFEHVYPVSARRGNGVRQLVSAIVARLPEPETVPANGTQQPLRLSILGRPNVGKSTLVNRILGEQRVLTSEVPGTTRDSIHVPLCREGKSYLLVDTAGIRRRSRIHDSVEKSSVVQSFLAIQQSDIVILMLDAQECATEQDAALMGIVADSGYPLIIAVNKWDGLSGNARQAVRRQLERKCGFVHYAQLHFISALHGSGIGDIFASANAIEASLRTLPKAGDLTTMLHRATSANPPPIAVGQKRIKLRYAHLGGNHPLRVIVHGNQTQHLPASYLRFLARSFREQMKLVAIPVLVECRRNANPYRERRNRLSPRQQRRRQRLIRHHRQR